MSNENIDRVANFLAAKRKEEGGGTDETAVSNAVAAAIAAAMPDIAKAVTPAPNTDMQALITQMAAQQEQTQKLLASLAAPVEPETPAINMTAMLEGVAPEHVTALQGTPGFAEALAQIAVNAAGTVAPKAEAPGNDIIQALTERLAKAESTSALAALQSQSPRLGKYMGDPKFMASLEKENEQFGIPNQLLYNAALKSGNVKTLDTLFDSFEASLEDGDLTGLASPGTGGHTGGTGAKTHFTIEDIERASEQAVSGKISTADLDSMVSAFEAQNAA